MGNPEREYEQYLPPDAEIISVFSDRSPEPHTSYEVYTYGDRQIPDRIVPLPKYEDSIRAWARERGMKVSFAYGPKPPYPLINVGGRRTDPKDLEAIRQYAMDQFKAYASNDLIMVHGGSVNDNSDYLTLSEENNVDGATKAAIGLIIVTILIIVAVMGAGVWGFVELVQWITSK